MEKIRDAWIRLARSFSPNTFWEALRSANNCAVEALQKTEKNRYSLVDFYREKELAEQSNAQWVLYNDFEYPKLLRKIPDAPPVLTVIGNKDSLCGDFISVIGARNSSAAGIIFTEKICEQLNETGISVTSGMARGIDAAAHRGSIKRTVAVLPGGVDKIYPEENWKLYQQIIENGGAVVSDKPIGITTNRYSFQSRNRIVAGMSAGVVVVEATEKSGSLMTARFASEYGREVFAVPGHPLDPRSKGTNWLIRNGANIFESIDDIDSTILFGTQKKHDQREVCTKDCDDSELLGLLSATPIELSHLAQILGRTNREVRVIYTKLELKGLAKTLHDGSIIRA